MKLQRIFFTILLLCSIIISSSSYAQIDNRAFTGASKNKLDTLALENSVKMVEQSAGVFEREIDADLYTVGPNDIFNISILSTKSIEFKSIISPEGFLILPGYGMVNLKDKSLTEAKKIILERVKKFKSGDEIHITLADVRKFKVSVSGEIPKPVMVTATAVDRVSEIIDKAFGMNYEASVRKILLYRDGVTPIDVDLTKYFLFGDKSANPYVLGGDHIIVPPSNENDIIEISGEVAAPGIFEFVEGDSLSTLIRFALGFKNTAELRSVELVHQSDAGTVSEYLDLSNWKGLLKNDMALPNDRLLRSGDRVYVRKKENWEDLYYVIIQGEVNKPGKYAIEENSVKISEILDRAGGFTEEASIKATQLIRQQEMERVDPELERLSGMPPSEMSISELRYYLVKSRERKGVAAIDFQKIINDSSSSDNIVLRHMDSIVVPLQKDFINVQGRVNNPGIIAFKEGATYEYYIAMAGGYGYRADEGETFITKSKGEYFLAKNKDYGLEPGDVILVPPEEEYSFMEVFTTSLTIMSQLFTIVGVVVSLVRLR